MNWKQAVGKPTLRIESYTLVKYCDFGSRRLQPRIIPIDILDIGEAEALDSKYTYYVSSKVKNGAVGRQHPTLRI